MSERTTIADTHKRIASLDGLRAFAVVTVILCHLQQRFAFLPSFLPAPDGVGLFFVLSGFLITTLLLREKERNGSISLLGFYGRRAVRILPPLLVYLGIVLVVCVLSGQVVPWLSLISACLFSSNLYPHNSSLFTEHLWSLATEEQFYLLWPLLMILAMRHGGRRRVVQLAVVLIAASPLFRLGVTYLHWSFLAHKQGMVLPGRMDSLFAGCLAATCLGSIRFEQFYQRISRYWWAVPLFFCVISPVLRIVFGNAYTYSLGYTMEPLSAAYFVVWVSRCPESLIGRVLSWRPAAFVGTMSYSLYLYQSAIIHEWLGFAWNSSILGVLIVTATAGLLSFHLVEKPALWLRSRGKKVSRPAVKEASWNLYLMPVNILIIEKGGPSEVLQATDRVEAVPSIVIT